MSTSFLLYLFLFNMSPVLFDSREAKTEMMKKKKKEKSKR